VAGSDASLAVVTRNRSSGSFMTVPLADLFSNRDAALAEFRRRRAGVAST
jgi:hypothetical protein